MNVSVIRDMGVAVRVAAAQQPAGPNRARAFAISDESVDSHNTTFSLKGWDFTRFAKNPLVLLNHGGNPWVGDVDPLPVIGRSNTPSIEKDSLLAEVEFFPVTLAPEADRAMGLVDAGVLGASIRAIPDYASAEYNEERETGDDWTDFFYPPLDFKRQTLVEWSVVVIGSNANAVPPGRALNDAEARLMASLCTVRGDLKSEREQLRASLQGLRQVKNLPERFKKLLADDARKVTEHLEAARSAAAAPAAVPAPAVAPEAPKEEPMIEIPAEVDLRELFRTAIDDTLRAEQARRRGSLSVE